MNARGVDHLGAAESSHAPPVWTARASDSGRHRSPHFGSHPCYLLHLKGAFFFLFPEKSSLTSNLARAPGSPAWRADSGAVISSQLRRPSEQPVKIRDGTFRRKGGAVAAGRAVRLLRLGLARRSRRLAANSVKRLQLGVRVGFLAVLQKCESWMHCASEEFVQTPRKGPSSARLWQVGFLSPQRSSYTAV